MKKSQGANHYHFQNQIKFGQIFLIYASKDFEQLTNS